MLNEVEYQTKGTSEKRFRRDLDIFAHIRGVETEILTELANLFREGEIQDSEIRDFIQMHQEQGCFNGLWLNRDHGIATLEQLIEEDHIVKHGGEDSVRWKMLLRMRDSLSILGRNGVLRL